MNEIGLVIMAAGDSSRLGFPKQLLEINGQSFLKHTVEVALEMNSPIVVVLGYNYERHLKEINDINVDHTFNLNWHKGIGSSIKSGFQRLFSQNTNLGGVILMACDQPFVSKDIIIKLTKALDEGHNLASSVYNNSYGFPLIIGRKYFKEIVNLHDDEDLSPIISVFGSYSIQFPNGKYDIDTEEDWIAFYHQYKHQKTS
jgi:molybdenum cofactor cytidylyltransferase